MANSQQSGMAGSGMQGMPAGYAQLMQSLMMNPAAFTHGGFGQTLAANPPQGGMSPQAAALSAGWQPNAPGQQVAPSPAFAWGQQYGGGSQQWPAGYAGSPIGQAIMGMSPQGAGLAAWQPAAPVQQQAPDPVGAFLAQQQAAQAAAQQAAQQAAAQPPPQPYDSNPGGSGGE